MESSNGMRAEEIKAIRQLRTASPPAANQEHHLVSVDSKRNEWSFGKLLVYGEDYATRATKLESDYGTRALVDTKS